MKKIFLVLAALVPALQALPAPGLLDFSVQPFSDQGSHFAIKQLPGGGFCAYELSSAAAFGNLAAAPQPAKRLFKFRVELEIKGKSEALFARPVSDTAEDYPFWITEKASEPGAEAESGLAMPETDSLVLAANFSNRSKQVMELRPRLVLEGGGANFDTSALFDAKSSLLCLSLDRSKLLLRKFSESLCILAGSGKSSAQFSGQGLQGVQELGSAAQLASAAFELRLGPQAYARLKPGQVLRFPIALSLAPDDKQARLPIQRVWKAWALPRGEALAKAQARWRLSLAQLPKASDPKFENLSRRAAATLCLSRYHRRSELKSDMLSQAKAEADAFFSDGLPMAALGFSELDHGAAEAALLELASFSSAAPAPVPPYTGEDLLLWEAAGLPWNGWAAWELYQRDPDLNRAAAFITGMALRLRNECAWWPSHRDADGNGLYAYANDDEKPWYLRQAALASPSPAASSGTSQALPVLQTYDVALSSFVAWQMQAASAMADAAGEKEESERLLALSTKSAQALKRESRGMDGLYGQGLDAYLPYLLGLDSDLPMARLAMQSLLKLAADPVPFTENGIFSPSRAYLMLRTLALYGYQDQAKDAAGRMLNFLQDKPLYSAYDSQGKGLGWAGDSASAGAILEMALGRYDQDAYLLPDSTRLAGGLLSVRSPDGSFYLKRVDLGAAQAAYSPLSLSATATGFELLAEKATHVSLISKWPLDISISHSKAAQPLYTAAKQVEMILKAKQLYSVKIEKP